MHHENLKKQKDKKIGPQQKLQKIDKMHLSNKARTARTQSNTMVNIGYKGLDFENEENKSFFKSIVNFM